MTIDRILATIVALVLAIVAPATIQSQGIEQSAVGTRRTVKVLLNSGISGANAWLLLADARGYFRYEGIDVQFTPGRGAYTAATHMVQDTFDFGYGDINALIEESSIRPETAPIGVFMVHNRSPSAIIMLKGSPITAVRQLAAKRIIGHPTDVALNTFDAFARRGVLDPNLVRVTPDTSTWTGLLGALERKEADGVFGYLSTSMAAIESSGRDVESTLTFLRFRDIAPELYGSALMASRAMVDRDPVIVRAFVRAANRGLVATVNDPDAAIAELTRRDPTQRVEVERNRLQRTLHGDMGAAEGNRIGIGDIDAKRFTLAIRMMHDACRLPRTPTWNEIFSREYLPPLLDRVRTLGEPER
ncbi:MAG: ABC transporter substrate-binding protein [Gemmatimonadaceae bacterium]|nr:ABC transporter substrate-binding protein [Gemmatimonadaceae bacterium]